MCSMDRIENTNCSQLDFFREMQLTVNLSSHPACIRLRDGSFSHFNHSFATTFLHNINVNIWFNRLEISSSLRLSALDAEVYSGDRKMLIEENCKRLVRTVLIFTESSDQLSRATDRVPGLPASPGYVQ